MPTNNSLFLDLPPEDNITPDGNLLITPEELELGPSIPPTSSSNPDILDRLCEYDLNAQNGCRRTQTVFALEAEYDTFVHPEMKWGPVDQYCIHEDSYFYYKTRLKEMYDVDRLASQNVSHVVEHLTIVNNHLGFDLSQPSVDYKDIILKEYKGFPTFQDQTMSFFRVESVGDTEITLDTMTKEVLDIVKSSFTDDVNPLLSNMARGLYIKDNKAYNANVFAWTTNANAKWGVFMHAAPSQNYPDSETTAYFFPFEQLTEDQIKFVTALYNLEKEDTTQRLEIVYL
jgi:hypothetical protein